MADESDDVSLGQAWPLRRVRLLDADPQLGDELDAEQLAQAREQAVLPAITLEHGPWHLRRLASHVGVRGKVRGFLVLHGLVTIDLEVAGRTCTRLITPTELVLLDGVHDDSIPTSWGWSILQPASLAVFDDRLLLIAHRWPGLMSAILKRAAQQVRHALLQQAISQLPRVEDRLLGLMWSVADRQGTVRADGVWVDLPVTHDVLAHMIGARRPTVSLGLKALHDRGLLSAHPDGWLINPDSLREFPGAPPSRDIAATDSIDAL